jgi:hypothetical protein
MIRRGACKNRVCGKFKRIEFDHFGQKLSGPIGYLVLDGHQGEMRAPRASQSHRLIVKGIIFLALISVSCAIQYVSCPPSGGFLRSGHPRTGRIPLAFAWPDEAPNPAAKKNPAQQKQQAKPKPGSKSKIDSTDPMSYLKATGDILASACDQANETAMASLKEARKVVDKLSIQAQKYLKQVLLRLRLTAPWLVSILRFPQNGANTCSRIALVSRNGTSITKLETRHSRTCPSKCRLLSSLLARVPKNSPKRSLNRFPHS